MPPSNELYHYGVLGMKWGVRRYQPYSVVPRGSGKGGKEIGEAKNKPKGLVGHVKAYLKKRKDKKKMAELRKIKAQKQLAKMQEEAARTAWEEAKKRMIESGDVAAAKQHIDKLSNEELNQILNRQSVVSRIEEANRQINKPVEDPKWTQTKQKILNTANTQDASKYADKLSSQELQDVLNKRTNMDKLEAYNDPMTKVNKTAAKVANMVDLVTNNADRIEKAYRIFSTANKLKKDFTGESFTDSVRKNLQAQRQNQSFNNQNQQQPQRKGLFGNKQQPQQNQQQRQFQKEYMERSGADFDGDKSQPFFNPQQTQQKNQNAQNQQARQLNQREQAKQAAQGLIKTADWLAKNENLSAQDQRDYEKSKKIINMVAKDPQKVQGIYNLVKDETAASLFSDPDKLMKFLARF